MLTKIESELNEVMWSRGVDLDTRIGVTIELGNEANRKAMIQWIKKNPSAGQSEIARHAEVINPEQTNVVHIAPKNSRAIKRIAMF